MPRLGDAIDIEMLVNGAEALASTMGHWDPVEFATSPTLTIDLLTMLNLATKHSLPRPGPVAIFGEQLLAAPDPIGGDYSEPITGVGAGLVGSVRSAGTVYVPKPIRLSDGTETHVVPAVSFNVIDIVLEEGPDLGVAQLYRRVAVPLLGQSLAVFQVIGVSWEERQH